MYNGCAVAGTIHFVNSMTADWYSRRQATVETATYGSEFVAPVTAVDQIIEFCTTLQYLGSRLRVRVTYLATRLQQVDSTCQLKEISVPFYARNILCTYHCTMSLQPL
jgi:hypothetical protein